MIELSDSNGSVYVAGATFSRKIRQTYAGSSGPAGPYFSAPNCPGQQLGIKSNSLLHEESMMLPREPPRWTVDLGIGHQGITDL